MGVGGCECMICRVKQISQISGDQWEAQSSTQVVLILKQQRRLEEGFKKDAFSDVQTNFEVPAEISAALGQHYGLAVETGKERLI